MANDELQTPGRKRNDAEPLGERPQASDKETERTGKRSIRAAGPDGPNATVLGDFAKRRP